jgi:DNA-directed RNA polymerase III subunit RPC6
VIFFQVAKIKVYMLFDLQPDRSVTGGSWYTDGEFESELVDIVNQQCYRMLQQKAEVAKLKAVS